MVELGISVFWTQSRQEQRRNFPEQTQKLAEQTWKFTEWSQCGFWFWFVLLQAICWHWHAAFIQGCKQSCFSRSWLLSSSLTSHLMAVRAETLASAPKPLYTLTVSESPLTTKAITKNQNVHPKEPTNTFTCMYNIFCTYKYGFASTNMFFELKLAEYIYFCNLGIPRHTYFFQWNQETMKS